VCELSSRCSDQQLLAFKRAGGTCAIALLLKSSDEEVPSHHLRPPLRLCRCKESYTEGEGDVKNSDVLEGYCIHRNIEKEAIIGIQVKHKRMRPPAKAQA
jgi:hypothetical protein